MYDILIAGSGVAGLSLAYHLVQGPFYGARILLVDRTFEETSNHALSFWTADTTPYEPVVAHTWRRLKVAGPGFEKEAPLEDLRYQTIGAVDFRRFVSGALGAAPAVTRLQGDVSDIEDGVERATAWVDGRPYRARWIFDSRHDPDDFTAAAGHVTFWQRFQGWEIVTANAHFDPQTATLMDLRAPQAGCSSWCFFYVLPTSTRRALVELVTVDNAYDAQTLQAYIGNVLHIDDYEIVRREAGATPLTSAPLRRRLGRRVMAIGSKGGLIKPSTGYGFLRMQEDGAAIAQSLLTHGHPFDVPGDGRFHHFCDLTMLHMLAKRGSWALPLFSTLFEHNPPQRVLRFLDESATPLQTARLTLSLVPRVLSLALRDARRDDDRTRRADRRGAGLREAGGSLMGGATEGQ